jgi:DNA-binding NarL/FixJ family response regulator
MGCHGAHEFEGNWMPCADHATLLRISNRAEKSLESELKPRKKRKKRGAKPVGQWEDLGQRGVLSITSTPGVGISSGGAAFAGKAAPGPCWPGYVMVGRKPGKNGRMVPNCVPAEQKSERIVRTTDPDVFTSRESARVRARQLGCIGIRQYSSYSGGPAWMPCTNESDYRRSMGTSPQGRRDVAKRQVREMRKAFRRLGKSLNSNFCAKTDSVSKTPAPKKDQIFGSSRNARGTASSVSSASKIELSKQVESSLKGSLKRHNDRMKELEKPDWSMASLDQLKAVWRRGAGAFSVSHRPGMTRSQWAFARVRAFLWMLEKGKPKKLSYISDVDLISSSHPFKKRGISRKVIISLAAENSIEMKARFIRATRLGPSISRRRTALFRRPKSDRDGDGDGFRWNPATGRDDLQTNFGKRTVIAKRKTPKVDKETAEKKPRKRKSKPSKIDQAKLIELINAGHTQAAIGKYFGVDQSTISHAKSKIPSELITRPKLRAARTMSDKPPSDADIEKIKELANNGFTAYEIASNLGLPPVVVDRLVTRMKRRGQVIASTRRGAGQPINEAKANEIARMYNEGSSITEIALSLGRTYQSVATSISKLRKEGRISGSPKEKKTRRRVIWGPSLKIPKEKIPELKEKYHSLRQTMTKTRALQWLAREFDADSMTVRNALGADYLKDNPGKTKFGAVSGVKSKFTDVEKRRIQREYAELVEDMSPSAARQFLADYYGAATGTIVKVVGRGRPEFLKGEFRTENLKPKRKISEATIKRNNQIVALVKLGRKNREIAETLGISTDYLRVIKSRLKEEGRLSEQDAPSVATRRQMMIDMYNNGATIEEIADALRMSRRSVAPILVGLRKQGLVGRRNNRGSSPRSASDKPSMTASRKIKESTKKKNENISKIIDIVSENPNVSVTEIHESTGIGKGLIFATIRDLKEQGLIERRVKRGIPKKESGDKSPKPKATKKPQAVRPEKIDRLASLPDSQSRIRDLYIQGMTSREIAKALDVGDKRVREIITRLFDLKLIMGEDLQQRTRNISEAKRAKRNAKLGEKSLYSLDLPERFTAARYEVQQLASRFGGKNTQNVR